MPHLNDWYIRVPVGFFAERFFQLQCFRRRMRGDELTDGLQIHAASCDRIFARG